MKEKHPFDIDINRLEQEWTNHPREYYRCAVELADARAEYDRSKRERDVVIAELDKAIRTVPEQFDLTGKVTEAMVERTIHLQRRYHLADNAMIDAKHAMDICFAQVNAMDCKKYALQDMVKLLIGNFFSVPKVSGDAREYTDQAEKRDARRRGKD